jgi:3-methyladenine DNA glycosylase AlkD
MGDQQSRAEAILAQLQAQANPENVAGMARFGIRPAHPLGISVRALREIARPLGRDHALAAHLWASGIHEARILASIVDDPRQASEDQLERWALDFDSWDICDQCCGNLFVRTPFAYEKAVAWSARDELYVKRAGFVLIAGLVVHDKRAPDERLSPFFALIRREADDERNEVKKAVNWALRQLGKRSAALHAQALALAEELRQRPSRAARWVAGDALRELRSDAVQARLLRKVPGS